MCKAWEPLASLTFDLAIIGDGRGTYSLAVGHRHYGHTDVVKDFYHHLKMLEVRDIIDVTLETHRIGHRHPWAEAKQESFFS